MQTVYLPAEAGNGSVMHVATSSLILWPENFQCVSVIDILCVCGCVWVCGNCNSLTPCDVNSDPHNNIIVHFLPIMWRILQQLDHIL